MSNTSSSPVVLRLPQSALVFIVLITALGALLLASNSIDRSASIRAQFTLTPSITPTPIDPFANQNFVAWSSPDRLITLEHPADWAPRPNPQAAIGYFFTVPGVDNVAISLVILPTSELGVPGVAPNATAEEVLKAAFAGQSGVEVRPVQIGEFTGGGVKRTQSQVNPATGRPVSLDRDLLLLNIDPQTVIIMEALSPTEQWPQMEQVFTRAVNSLKIDKPGVAALLARIFAPPTPAPTSAATVAPTGEATSEPTAAATTAATAAPEATAAPTAEPAAEPTQEVTAAPTAAATP